MANIDLKVSGKKFTVLDSSGQITYTLPVAAGIRDQALILDANNNLVFQDAGFTGRSIGQLDDVDSSAETPAYGQTIIWNGSIWFPDSIASDGVDSAGVLAVVDSAYIQTAIHSSYLSTIIDQSYIESKIGGNVSNQITGTINASYIQTYADATYVKGIVDSAYITNTINSAYVKEIADSAYIKSALDSAYFENIIDSAYISTIGLANVVDDVTPELGGNLDVGDNNIISTSNRNIDILSDNYLHLQLSSANDHSVGMYDTYFFPNTLPADRQVLAAGFSTKNQLRWTRLDNLGFQAVVTIGSTWSIRRDGPSFGHLIFTYNGVDKMKLDDSGNITITGTITQSGTI